MKQRFTKSVLLAVSAALVSREAAAVDYNGSIKYFIADLGATSPCHGLYERGFTWVETGELDVLDNVLEAIMVAGFNGVRFPMWPDDERLTGPDPGNALQDVSKTFCDEQTKIWIERIKSPPKDATFGSLFIHMSPGLDNRTFQENLTPESYGEWVLSYTSGDYSPDFMSPFSNNQSTLQLASIPDTSNMSDITTMWELETLKFVRNSQTFKDLTISANPVSIIGPDRGTTKHSINVLSSFHEDVSYIRPDYKALVDIVGTQTRLADPTAKESNYKILSESGLGDAWCTMCSQEWTRILDMNLGYSQQLRGSRAQIGFWSQYSKNWGIPQAPASQALLGEMKGFVAQAAIPRFVSNNGQVNQDRAWNQGEKMVDIDGSSKTFDSLTQTESRNIAKPDAGFRRNLAHILPVTSCQFSDPEEGKIDRFLAGYETCVYEFTEKEWRDNNYQPMKLYVDTPKDLYVFSEVCQTGGKQLCNTRSFQIGTDVQLGYNPELAIRIIFENDDTEDKIFQVDVKKDIVGLGETETSATQLLGAAAAVTFTLSTILF